MPHHHKQAVPTHMSQAQQLPLTPPEVWGTGSSHYDNQQYGAIGQAYYPQSQYTAAIPKRPCQHDEHSLPPASAPIYGAYRQDYGYKVPPILPPIRTYDLDLPPQPLPQPVQEPKEEKVAGGVASTLTYKMDQMVDFVSEKATAIVRPKASVVTPEFRKCVSQILTSTRLPISTIMLAMDYLAQRMELVQGCRTETSRTAVHQMLTTALMLASKFLDDNTFQNRSWAEVSNIAVADLNKREMEWLMDMGWHLHFDVDANFSTWMQSYERYAEQKKVQSSLEALKLSHAENVRPQSTRYLPPQTPLYTPPSHHEASFSQPRERPNPWQQWNPPRTLSPSSAGASYPTTPADWFKDPSTGFGQHSMTYSNRPLPPLQILPSNQSPFHSANCPQQYTPLWTGHHPGCHCAPCSSDYHHRYSSYGIQSMA